MSGTDVVRDREPRVSVVTLNAGRDRQLLLLVEGLARCRPAPLELVVVAMGDEPPPVAEVAHRGGAVPVRWVHVDAAADGSLPLAAARNAGARAARGTVLVFLDVDCIPGPDLIGAYAAALTTPGVATGPVRWLERFWDHDLDDLHQLPTVELLDARSAPHPVRPVPEQVTDDARHELLWSLAFGMRAVDFAATGGFDEGYVGYGAEDTDLGMRAREAGLPMRWLPTGTAHHQWHRVSDPPVEHVDAIVTNARRFHRRWGRWPMEGWLAAFAADGLVTWAPDGDHLERVSGQDPTHPVRVVAIPATHPYVRRVLPDDAEVAADPTRPWWPHPALLPAWVDEHVAAGDVVHLHFGYEHRTSDEMREWCDTCRAAGAGLVVTVHDVDNPHLAPDEQDAHHQRVAIVLGAADVVLTLTEAAAAEVRTRWGVDPEIVPHPHVAAIDHRPHRRAAEPATIGADLKVGRPGSLDHELVLAALGRAASREGARAIAWLERGVPAAERHRTAQLATHHGVELRVEAAPDDAGLVARFASLDVALLPYRCGTHSGLLELCRDVGTRPVVPSIGAYADQWREAVPFAVDAGRPADVEVVVVALRRALALGPPVDDPAGWRSRQRDEVRRHHAEVYRRASALASARSATPAGAGVGR